MLEKAPRRLVYLDVLRALAILLVLGRHRPADEFGSPSIALNAWFKVGWVGVDLFFVLSGFLIGGLLFNEFRRRSHISIARFYLRRMFKIWPAYFSFLIICTLIFRRAGTLSASFWETRYNWLHLQNYLGTPYGQTWSLAVEEHFYLVLPLLLFMAMRVRAGQANPFRGTNFIVLAIVLGCLAIRLITAARQDQFNYYRNVLPTHLRIDGLAVGVLMAYWVAFHRDSINRLRPYRHLLLVPTVAALSWVAGGKQLGVAAATYTWGFTFAAIGSAAAVMWTWFASTHDKKPGILAKGMAWIGVYSYSIYLWHIPLGRSMVVKFGLLVSGNPAWGNTWIGMTVYLVFSISLGVAGYFLIERPALHLRDKIFPSKSVVSDPPEQPLVSRAPVLSEVTTNA